MTFKRGDIVRVRWDGADEPSGLEYIVLGIESHGFSFDYAGTTTTRQMAWKLWGVGWAYGYAPIVVQESNMIATGKRAIEVKS